MVTTTYDPERDITPRFLQTVTGWIVESQEVFIVLRYLCMAGAKDYAFIRNPSELTQLIHACPVGTDIVVFRNLQLPFRGIVTDEFIAEVVSAIPAKSEYLLVCTFPESSGDLPLRGEMGDTHEELIVDLKGRYGAPVAVGICPSFCENDNVDMISASKGGVDGPR